MAERSLSVQVRLGLHELAERQMSEAAELATQEERDEALGLAAVIYVGLSLTDSLERIANVLEARGP